MSNKEITSKFNDIVKKKKYYDHAHYNLEIKEERDEFNRKFDRSMFCLKDEYQDILKHTFLDGSYKFWWLERYCKSSYYRERFRAMTSFVLIFEILGENY